MKLNITKAAKIIRSKNAGPYELTLDIIFKNKKYYKLFIDQNIITKKTISKIYKVKEKDIVKIVHFDPSNAIKVTMKRWLPSGSVGDRDIYGAQQHAPLLTLEFDA